MMDPKAYREEGKRWAQAHTVSNEIANEVNDPTGRLRPEREIRLSLTAGDWADLMLMVGYASGAADRAGNTQIRAIFQTLCERLRAQQEGLEKNEPR